MQQQQKQRVSRDFEPDQERIAATTVPDNSRQVLVLFENGASMVVNYSSGHRPDWIGPVPDIGKVIRWKEITWSVPHETR